MIRFKAATPGSDPVAKKPPKPAQSAAAADAAADTPVALPFGKAPKKESKKAGFGRKKPKK